MHNSECDKFEAHAAKLNEAIMIQILVNCKTTMDRIELQYGPFEEDEIMYYYHMLCKDGEFKGELNFKEGVLSKVEEQFKKSLA